MPGACGPEARCQGAMKTTLEQRGPLQPLPWTRWRASHDTVLSLTRSAGWMWLVGLSALTHIGQPSSPSTSSPIQAEPHRSTLQTGLSF